MTVIQDINSLPYIANVRQSEMLNCQVTFIFVREGK